MVVLKSPVAATVVERSKKIENNFITSPSKSLTANVNLKLKKKPYKFFPRLGIYAGYMNKDGIKKTENASAQIYGAESFSLIRPVSAKTAKSKGSLTWGLKKLGIDKIWKQGISGKNIKVGHLDTGVDGKHSALKGKLAGFIETDANGDIIPNKSVKHAHDTDDHGTHTAGTICGGKVNGMSIGVAPKSKLYSGLVIEGGDVLIRVLTGMEWCLENNVRVLNMSLGFRGYTPFFIDVTRRLRQSGALPVFAIGNEGPNTSRSPGNYPEALSVGATNNVCRVASFSSSIRFNRKVEPEQPNVVAPGVDVISAKPNGGVQAMSGTSMATPHVAGIAVLLFDSQRDATVDDVERAIFETCKPVPNAKPIRYGLGYVDPQAAIARLEKIV